MRVPSEQPFVEVEMGVQCMIPNTINHTDILQSMAVREVSPCKEDDTVCALKALVSF